MTGGPDVPDDGPLSVPCPHCGADAGQKCQRPSGHTAFGGSVHADRREVARLETPPDAFPHASVHPDDDQSTIEDWSGGGA